MDLPSASARLTVARTFRRAVSARPSTFARAIASRPAARVSAHLSATAALAATQHAADTVPAYADFLRSHGWTAPRRTRRLDPAAVLATLPETSKRTYIDRYSTDERCTGGRVPTTGIEVDESSGSSGRPYSWVRSTTELAEMRTTLSRLARYLLGDELVTINAFSMGAWATGTNVSAALGANGVLKSTGPDPEKILTALQLLGPDRHYVLTGYPPFLADLLEHADRDGFPIDKYRLSGIVGGEAMSETLRTRLLTRFDTIYSAYGASDLDIGVAAEMPLSVWIRQRAHEHPALARALFGDERRLPMLFQYDPLDYYAERNGHGELVVTVNRPNVVSPRVRYNVHDAGGVLGFDHVIEVCRSFGLDPLRDAPLAAGAHRGMHACLPFLYVSGRSDATISYFGANIYPDDVEQAVFADASAPEPVHGFSLELIEGTDGAVHPCVHIELTDTTTPTPDLTATLAPTLADRVRARLSANSRDYRVAVGEDPRAGAVEVRLHAYESGPFAVGRERIKRRYVIGTTHTTATHSTATAAPFTDPTTGLPADHAAALRDALRAPSAHNAQPWRIHPVAGALGAAHGDTARTAAATYELHYDHTEYLPHDPDDRDAHLTMGAFVETLVLAAPNHGLHADVDVVLQRDGADLIVARVTLRPSTDADAVDALSAHVARRAMNRSPYDRRTPVDPALRDELARLGNAFVTPRAVAPVLFEASARSWADRQFVKDLAAWYRTDPDAADGFTAPQMHMTRSDRVAFRLARAVGRVPRPFHLLFPSRDLQLLRATPTMAVLAAHGTSPEDVFDAGRRLLRSWVAIAAAGHSCHPFSVAIDVRATAPKLATLAGVDHPMALYRVGRTSRAPWAGSHRRELTSVLRGTTK